MKLEDQLVTKQQAKRLKELGVTGDAIWYWVYPKKAGMISTQAGICNKTGAEEIVSDNEGDEFDHEMSAAYSVAELGVMLNHKTNPRVYHPLDDDTNRFYVNTGYDSKKKLITEEFQFEAHARGRLIILHLEKKWITPEEINNRLNS